MRKKKQSAPTSAATLTGAVENGTTSQMAHASTKYDTTFRAGGQIQIADLLMHGADHALPLRQLKQMTGLPGRDLRRRIQMERLSGVPILSDCENGYFLPDSPAEVRRFVQSMRDRAKEIEAVADVVEGAGTDWI